MLFFRSTTKNNEVIGENRFRTIASLGACERLAVLNWRSSSTYPSSLYLCLYILYFYIYIRDKKVDDYYKTLT